MFVDKVDEFLTWRKILGFFMIIFVDFGILYYLINIEHLITGNESFFCIIFGLTCSEMPHTRLVFIFNILYYIFGALSAFIVLIYSLLVLFIAIDITINIVMAIYSVVRFFLSMIYQSLVFCSDICKNCMLSINWGI